MQRDTYKYELKRGKEVVYVGITNGPERREALHRQDKDFDRMNIIGRVSTREGAEQWETDRLETYMRNHNGNLPKYNQTVTGK
jgi:predicted GIY-YIG superfamily endonuclease